MKPSRQRFYKNVSVEPSPAAHRSYRVLLDGKPVRTPNGTVLEVPSEPLAQAIAEEWRSQDTELRPERMTLTKLANTAVDRAAPQPQQAREQALSFARTDVVCYRADSPSDLVEGQQHAWDPLLAWVRDRFGASLRTGNSLAFVEQDSAALDALYTSVSQRDPFVLAGLNAAAVLLGSLVIALALAERKLGAEDAFTSADLDTIYQAVRCGLDEMECAESDAESAELNQISRFLELLW